MMYRYYGPKYRPQYTATRKRQMNKWGKEIQQSVQSQRADRIMTDKEDNDQRQSVTNQWNTQNISRALEMLKSGEGSDCVIEVQEQQPKDDDPSPKRKCASSQIGQAGEGIQQQQQQDVQSEEFNVHKYILIANSEVFSAMFSHKNTTEFREGRIIIKDSTITAVRQMVHYMYTGKISDDYDRKEDAIPLMAIAHKYQIKPLMDFNEPILIKSLTLENVFERLKFADIFQTEKLKSGCAHMIWHHMKDLKKGPEWMELKENLPKLAFYVVEKFI